MKAQLRISCNPAALHQAQMLASQGIEIDRLTLAFWSAMPRPDWRRW
jgi:hypothetical protein